MKSFKQQCVELRKKDKTLNEIMEITGRSKTTVYFHIKDIELSKKKKAEIEEQSRKQARKNAAARKGVALRPYKTFDQWTPELVLLVSHLLFDGEILRSRCTYNNRSKSLTDRVERLMTTVYEFPAKLNIVEFSEVRRVQYFNVELASFLNTKARELLKVIVTMPQSSQCEFLRAFFDDEGCMDYRPKSNRRRIRGYQKDEKILFLIQELLKNFAIEAKIREPNEVVISGKENLQKFRKEINFSQGVCLNPKRANSIWKKPIEKRVLLDMAIKSFKN